MVQDSLEQILDELPVEEDLIVVDLYNFFLQRTDLDLDNVLYDVLISMTTVISCTQSRSFGRLGAQIGGEGRDRWTMGLTRMKRLLLCCLLGSTSRL